MKKRSFKINNKKTKPGKTGPDIESQKKQRWQRYKTVPSPIQMQLNHREMPNTPARMARISVYPHKMLARI